MRPMVYIASPYTMGDVGINVRSSIEVMSRLLRLRNCIPFSPLSMSHLAHIVQPMEYEEWMHYLLGAVEHCQAMVRVNAIHGEYVQCESPGADREVRRAIDLGLPVFFTVEDLEDWIVGL